jgi:hypothetical protein
MAYFYSGLRNFVIIVISHVRFFNSKRTAILTDFYKNTESKP